MLEMSGAAGMLAGADESVQLAELARPPARVLRIHRRRQPGRKAFEIGQAAVRSLHAELCLYPKPGLVSPVDSGSHRDMCAATFMRSLFSLRGYFIEIAQAGMEGAPFAVLRQLGMDAERRMLEATCGVNTHRGAIFCLGMLCAAAGRCQAEGLQLSPAAIRSALTQTWGAALASHAAGCPSDSHGGRVAARYAVGGARREAALGLPAVFELALPAMRRSLADGRTLPLAQIDALFALMAHLDDSNVYHRGGKAGAALVKARAQAFLNAGGTAQPGWFEQAVACHRLFVRRRLSPGGTADLLAATCLVHELSGIRQ